jgi:hypothetical protein
VVSTLTTPDLEGLKRLLNDAAGQRRDFESSVANALKVRNSAWRALERARKFPLKLFKSGSVPRLEAGFEQAQNWLEEEVAKLNACHVQVDFAFDPITMDAYKSLTEAHRELRRSQKIWDVTSSIFVDRATTRSAASSSVTRQLVTLSDAKSGIVASKWVGLRFENANGEDIELFPGFCLMQESKGNDYALIDLREIDLRFAGQRFIENEELPNDALIIGHAWEKSNKDGSPDRRFSDNRQLPIMGYGRLEFRTGQGLNEAYMISDQERARQFVIAFTALQNSLRSPSSEATKIEALGSPQTLVEPISPYQIPDVPNTPGAHEYIVGAFAIFAIAGGLAWWDLTSSPQAPVPALPISQSVVTTVPARHPPASAAAAIGLTETKESSGIPLWAGMCESGACAMEYRSPSTTLTGDASARWLPIATRHRNMSGAPGSC